MENSLAIANYFVKKSLQTGSPITPMKLLKLVYISHGWYLGLTEKPLIDEGVQAWKYGPVIPRVYHAFKSYGGEPITSLESTFVGTKFMPPLPDEKLFPFLDKIWDVYNKYDGFQLSALTHEPNSPWDKTIKTNEGSIFSGVVIPNNVILQHYKDRINANRTA